ncbi:MAG: NUDIX domain-containing protein [Ardenticatenaceae bacterium]|nr:NUDIX domain-containing protein [Ardenticatenaceae bacterium]
MSKSYISWIRQRVGRQKIFLVTSSIVLRDASNRILLQRRTDFDVWGLPGGALEIDEDIQACARRELFEETGLEAGKLDLVGIYTHPHYDVTYPNGDKVQQYTVCLTGRLSGGTMSPDGLETSDQAFFAVDEMEALPVPHWYWAMIRDAERGGPPAFTPPFVAERPSDQIQLMRQHVGHERIVAVGAMTATTRDDGRFLMVRRRDNGAWTFPAGYSDLGENAAHTAVRETLEETGYHVTLERILAIYSSPTYHHTFPNGDQVKNVGTLFLARLESGEAVPELQEVTAVSWLLPEEVLQTVPDFFRPLYAQVFANIASDNRSRGGALLD